MTETEICEGLCQWSECQSESRCRSRGASCWVWREEPVSRRAGHHIPVRAQCGCAAKARDGGDSGVSWVTWRQHRLEGAWNAGDRHAPGLGDRLCALSAAHSELPWPAERVLLHLQCWRPGGSGPRGPFTGKTYQSRWRRPVSRLWPRGPQATENDALSGSNRSDGQSRRRNCSACEFRQRFHRRRVVECLRPRG
jgi:hypothetical protein